MSNRTAYINREIIIDGQAFMESLSIGHDQLLDSDTSPGPAADGSLTTRTSASVGTLTMETGHGIATGNKISIYWEADTELGVTAGSRTNVTVGTVATNSVPFSLGSGDDLPLVNTVITAMKQSEELFAVDDGVLIPIYIMVTMNAIGAVIFAQADGTPILTVNITIPGKAYVWDSESGATNPIAGADTAKILITHGDSENAQRVYVALGY